MRILSYGSGLHSSVSIPLARTVLERMDRAVQDGTAMPIRGFDARSIEGLTDGPDMFDRIIRIDAGPNGPPARTIEELVHIARISLEAVIAGDIDASEEDLVREALLTVATVRTYEATVARGEDFPVRAVITSPSPWTAAKAISLCHPPLVVFGVPLAVHDGFVLPRMVTLDAEIGDGEDATTLPAPRNTVIRTMSDGVGEEPDPVSLLRLHRRLEELRPVMELLASEN